MLFHLAEVGPSKGPGQGSGAGRGAVGWGGVDPIPENVGARRVEARKVGGRLISCVAPRFSLTSLQNTKNVPKMCLRHIPQIKSEESVHSQTSIKRNSFWFGRTVRH